MNNPLHHNKLGKTRNWVCTARYPGLEPFQMGTMAALSVTDQEVHAEFYKWAARKLPPGFVLSDFKRGRMIFIKEEEA